MNYSSIQNQVLFWDTDLASLDLQKHKEFIIARVLENGTMDDVRWLRSTYSDEEIKQTIIITKWISKKTAIFWKNVLNIKEEIRCLSDQYQKTHKELWSY